MAPPAMRSAGAPVASTSATSAAAESTSGASSSRWLLFAAAAAAAAGLGYALYRYSQLPDEVRATLPLATAVPLSGRPARAGRPPLPLSAAAWPHRCRASPDRRPPAARRLPPPDAE